MIELRHCPKGDEKPLRKNADNVVFTPSVMVDVLRKLIAGGGVLMKSASFALFERQFMHM